MRPIIPIPASPKAPYPILVRSSHVIPGFGRGSSEIGIPTANVPIDSSPELANLDTGVYFGFVRLHRAREEDLPETKEILRADKKTKVKLTYGRGLTDIDLSVLPMVMSLGWNPYFKNEEKACELHILHKFGTSFYGSSISFNVLGYIRPELDYTTLEDLIKDIHIDIETAEEYLKKDGYKGFAGQLQSETN
ncbi:DEKNAAC100958 [Brettanomyces naardenensis]|uniref:Riboflavin kinase n=1 Tax=Brettanomyces naardenensis TaxID=13370 RepID=A0A448YH00_BRENA|nr:DEKNAAC100958 [Brettanomyces naardenensis]